PTLRAESRNASGCSQPATAKSTRVARPQFSLFSDQPPCQRSNRYDAGRSQERPNEYRNVMYRGLTKLLGIPLPHRTSLSAVEFRRRGLERLYKRLSTVEALIQSLEDYRRVPQIDE